MQQVYIENMVFVAARQVNIIDIFTWTLQDSYLNIYFFTQIELLVNFGGWFIAQKSLTNSALLCYDLYVISP